MDKLMWLLTIPIGLIVMEEVMYDAGRPSLSIWRFVKELRK